jgi:hypothetical protein
LMSASAAAMPPMPPPAMRMWCFTKGPFGLRFPGLRFHALRFQGLTHIKRCAGRTGLDMGAFPENSESNSESTFSRQFRRCKPYIRL